MTRNAFNLTHDDVDAAAEADLVIRDGREYRFDHYYPYINYNQCLADINLNRSKSYERNRNILLRMGNCLSRVFSRFVPSVSSYQNKNC